MEHLLYRLSHRAPHHFHFFNIVQTYYLEFRFRIDLLPSRRCLQDSLFKRVCVRIPFLKSSRERWCFLSWWNKAPMEKWQKMQQAGRQISTRHVHMIPMSSQYVIHLDRGPAFISALEFLFPSVHKYGACFCRHVCACECVTLSTKYGASGWWTCGFHIFHSSCHLAWSCLLWQVC